MCVCAFFWLLQAHFENGVHYFDIPMDRLRSVLTNGETLETLADNSATVSIEATVNGKVEL